MAGYGEYDDNELEECSCGIENFYDNFIEGLCEDCYESWYGEEEGE